jgi:hypothetical protein
MSVREADIKKIRYVKNCRQVAVDMVEKGKGSWEWCPDKLPRWTRAGTEPDPEDIPSHYGWT